MLEASIVVIGDEILGGFVQDANSPWLAERLREHAVPLTRIHTVPDTVGAIDEVLRIELARRRPRVVLTTGGVGSTPDDLTYEAVGASLGLDLVEDAVIGDRVLRALDWTRAHGVDVDEEFAWHMMRIARIPEGSTLLRDDSWVPGIRLDVDGGIDREDGATVVILPGVPSELRAIVREAVEPQLLAGRNEPQAIREVTHSFPESALNLCFARLNERYPSVKVGSYPGVPMLVRLCGATEEVDAATEDLRGYLRALEDDPGGASLRDAWARRFGAAIERERR